MRLYAEDAAETDKPWERWEFGSGDHWVSLANQPGWMTEYEYRRIPQPIKVEGWVNVYPSPSHGNDLPLVSEIHGSREVADGCRGANIRIACKHITFEYTPGERLE